MNSSDSETFTGRAPAGDAPLASVRPHPIASPHGERLDPYYWLRDDERRNSEVLAYLKAENAYKERQLAPIKPLEDKLYAEIIARLKQDDSTVPYHKNGYWYYTRFEPGKEHPIFARRKDSQSAPEQVILDANERAAGHEYYRLDAVEVSPDSDWVAFCEDTVGRRQYCLGIKNLRSGEILTDSIYNVEANVAWANDNATVLYVEKDPETLLGLHVKKHRRGDDTKADTLVFDPDRPELLHRPRQVEIGTLHLHLYGKHPVLGVALRAGRRSGAVVQGFPGARARSRIPNRAPERSLHRPHQLARDQFSPDAGAHRRGGGSRPLAGSGSRTGTIRSFKTSRCSSATLR